MTLLRRLDVVLAPACSGILLWLSFPEPSWYFLAWVGLVPYLAFLLTRPSILRTLTGHLLFSGTYLGGVLYWIPRVTVVYGGLSGVSSAGVFALMLLALSLFILPFSLLVRWLASFNASRALLAAPGFWVLSELLRNYYAVGGFPWAALGYSQYPYDWLIQISDLGGVFLVSYVVALGNCALLALLRGENRIYPVLFLGLFSLSNAYGIYRTVFWNPVGGDSVRVALVQPSIELARNREYYARMYFERLPAYYGQAAEQGNDWVLLPEAPNPYVFEQDFYFTTFWQKLVADYGTPVLFNGTAPGEVQGEYFNSAFLLDRGGRLIYRYDKRHLVPFGEYLPFGEVLGFAEALVQEVSSFTPGAEPVKPGRVNGCSFGTLICYEAIFPEISRDSASRGAGILVNLTNDSWFGETAAADQHLQMAVFRAIETRKPLLRCANSGFSAVVDAKGRFQGRLGLFKTGLIHAEVAPNREASLFVRFGDWPCISLIIVSFLVVPSSLRTGRKRRKGKKKKG